MGGDSENKVVLNDKRLKALIEAFSGKTPVARVGIFGDGKPRAKGFATNAEIGALHEFGGKNTEKRSWLRIPLNDHLKAFLEKAGLFDKSALDRVIKSGSLVPWVQKIAVSALDVVLEGFATGGFGKWKPSNMARKKVHMTLVETQQLRNSVIQDVVL